MNEFKEIREKVSIIRAAELYGLKIGRNGMCNCPFHEEKTNSMKLYERDNKYYCFGCHKSGDVIDLTAKLTGLPIREAAKQLSRDFGLGLFTNEQKVSKADYSAEIRKRLQEQERRKAEEQWVKNAATVIIEYGKILDKWLKIYRPQNAEQEINPLLAEALKNKSETDYLFEKLNTDSHDLYTNDKKAVEKIALRLREIMQQELHKIQPVHKQDKSVSKVPETIRKTSKSKGLI